MKSSIKSKSKVGVATATLMVLCSIGAKATGLGKFDPDKYQKTYDIRKELLQNTLDKVENSDSPSEFDQNFHEGLQVFSQQMGGDRLDQQITCSIFRTFDKATLMSATPFIERGLDEGKLLSCQQQIRTMIDSAHQIKKVSYNPADDLNPVKIPFEERWINPDLDYISLQGFNYKEVMLTFDDGPTVRTTLPILNTLDKYGVKAAFFSTGRQAQTNSRIMKDIAESGHVVASHSYYHTLMMGREVNRGNMSYDYFMSEFVGGHLGVYSSAETISPFFRFPNGCFNQTMRKNVREMGLVTFGWNVDSSDWQVTPRKYPNTRERSEKILDLFVSQLKARGNKGIVLMHDIYSQSAEALPLILNYLAENNFKVVLLKAPPGDRIPLVAEALSYADMHGNSLKDFRPPNSSDGNPVSPLNYVSKVNFKEIYPYLSEMPVSKIDPMNSQCEYSNSSD